MANPIPGLTREQPSKIITIFPDILIASRYSTLLIVKQIPISAEETWFETRYAYLAGDMPDEVEIRRQHWRIYWAGGRRQSPGRLGSVGGAAGRRAQYRHAL